jgi:UDP-glucose 4-epimerase
MSRVLVTGGAGFIGSHVSDRFLERGWSVDIIDDLSSGKRERVPERATLHVLDVRSPEAATLIVDGQFDAVVHLAGQIDVRTSVEQPMLDASINVLGTLNVLEAIRRSAGAKKTRVVFSSTGGAVYGDHVQPPHIEATPKEPDSPYAISKLAAEYYLSYYARLHEMNTVSLRFANVYGPRQDPHGEAGVVAIFCGRILTGRPLTVFGDGEQTRDYVHVRDVADAVFRGATETLHVTRRVDDRAYNVGTGAATSVVELANVLLRVSSATTSTIEYAPARLGELQHSSLKVDKIQRELGWTPRWTLDTGLADTFAWFAERERQPASAQS